MKEPTGVYSYDKSKVEEPFSWFLFLEASLLVIMT
jgi:hypothetical protein